MLWPQSYAPARAICFFLVSFLSICSWSTVASGQEAHNGAATTSSLLWGPYRPNLYFGVRPRIPQSLLMGLMWAKVDNFATVQNSGLQRTPKLLFDLNSMLIICKHRLQTHLRTTRRHGWLWMGGVRHSEWRPPSHT